MIKKKVYTAAFFSAIAIVTSIIYIIINI